MADKALATLCLPITDNRTRMPVSLPNRTNSKDVYKRQAPSLMQLAVSKCLDATTDVAAYDANRKLLYNALTEYGFECAKPEGAFYLWVKAKEDDKAFVAKGKEFHILMVPGSAFMCPGYVRIAYCVDHAMIERSLPAFKKLAECYQ